MSAPKHSGKRPKHPGHPIVVNGNGTKHVKPHVRRVPRKPRVGLPGLPSDLAPPGDPMMPPGSEMGW